MKLNVFLSAVLTVASAILPIQAALLEGGNTVGSSPSASYRVGNDNAYFDATGNATAEAGYGWKVDADGAELTGKAKVGSDGSISIGTEGQLGDDENNIHGSGEIKLSAELVAEIEGQFKVGDDGVVAKAGGKIGASASASGTVRGGVTLWGVPLDVQLTGAAAVGAEASAGAEFSFNPVTGKMKLSLQASAVVGGGVKGRIQVEIGISQLVELVDEKIGELWDWIKSKWNGEDESGPFDDPPESGGGGSSDKKERFQGLKPIKLF